MKIRPWEPAPTLLHPTSSYTDKTSSQDENSNPRLNTNRRMMRNTNRRMMRNTNRRMMSFLPEAFLRFLKVTFLYHQTFAFPHSYLTSLIIISLSSWFPNHSWYIFPHGYLTPHHTFIPFLTVTSPLFNSSRLLSLSS
uniref:Uncharacterized protein n=1 Tax=Cacopsylla melanoneura TaxID=428564 RepID=A0A8D8M1N8_9HEMI